MAMIGGMIYAMLHAVLSIKFLANQVISGVVVNILAVALTTFLTSLLNESLTGEASNKIQLGAAPRFTVPLISQIPILGAFFKDVYIFTPFILVFALIAWYVLYKTRYGLRLRACGENPSSVAAAAAASAPYRFTAVMICGALSGLAGTFFAYSTSPTSPPASTWDTATSPSPPSSSATGKFCPPGRLPVLRPGKIGGTSSPSPSASPAKSPTVPYPPYISPPPHLLSKTTIPTRCGEPLIPANDNIRFSL